MTSKVSVIFFQRGTIDALLWASTSVLNPAGDVTSTLVLLPLCQRARLSETQKKPHAGLDQRTGSVAMAPL